MINGLTAKISASGNILISNSFPLLIWYIILALEVIYLASIILEFLHLI